jgi:type II secretory pathway component PulM
MKSLFDKYNLRPQERRLVVIVALILFVVANIWFVFPLFSEWGRAKAAMARSQSNLKKYKDEIARRPQYEAELRQLQGEGGEMLADDLQFQRIVQNQAIAAGLRIADQHWMPIASGKTNQFFQEQALSIQFDSGGKELVDFLVNVAATNAMIRVRELNVKTDPSQTRLLGNVVLVGNYNQGKGPAPQKSPAATPVKTPPPRTASAPKTNSTPVAASAKIKPLPTPPKNKDVAAAPAKKK